MIDECKERMIIAEMKRLASVSLGLTDEIKKYTAEVEIWKQKIEKAQKEITSGS